MSESLLQQIQSAGAGGAQRISFDGRHPKRLDHHGYALQVTAGHVDLFAVSTARDAPESARHPLFRIEPGEIILDLDASLKGLNTGIEVIAIGSPGTEAAMLPRQELPSFDPIAAWIRRFAGLIAGSNPSWTMLEAASEDVVAVAPGERRRGPARSIIWLTLDQGSARPMGLDPAIAAGSPPLPLTSGMWIEAGSSGCSSHGGEELPEPAALWPAIDQFHRAVAGSLHAHLARDADEEARRLVRRGELTRARTLEAFDRLSAAVVPRAGQPEISAQSAPPLFAACQLVAEALGTQIATPPSPVAHRSEFADVVEIAQGARLRVRKTLLRGEWWTEDGGPLVGWFGEAGKPVALIRHGNR
ncbi:MAG: NHLP bacteriocin export ABC transporter permease/ATPase subunit, partial [bacterium]|nr:NHLP bacteriocin export ABC transporter permease/ATPase subunit [bacterium]